jgi:AcrR family transcriptional regulator
MRSGLTRAEKNERHREALLDAARSVFLESGFHGASLDAVADAAGLTKGAVYSRFDGKADLFLALLEARIEERIEQIRSVVGTGSVDGDTSALEHQYADIVRGQTAWTLLVLEFRVHAARHPEINRRYAEMHLRFKQAAADAAAPAMLQAGLTRERVDAYINAMFAFGAGVALEHAAHGEVFSADELERWRRAFLSHDHEEMRA